jgi:hypothetical protein
MSTRKRVRPQGVKKNQLTGLRAVLPPCGYLGAPTGETLDCARCGPGKRVKVFHCNGGHGTCTIRKPVGETQCCETCLDHTQRGEPK